MGKQASPRSPRPPPLNVDLSFGLKDYQSRCTETVSGIDPSFGRRTLGRDYLWHKTVMLQGLKSDTVKLGASKGIYSGKRLVWLRKHVRLIVFVFGLMGSLFLLDSLMFSIVHSMNLRNGSPQRKSSELQKDERSGYVSEEKSTVLMYSRLLNLAYSALAEKEFRRYSSNFWVEPYKQASAWKPCANKSTPINQGNPTKNTGFILVSANGGLNQQRVAVCNAVAVASLLNATLVVPKFLYSNVWKDPSQYQVALILKSLIWDGKETQWKKYMKYVLISVAIVYMNVCSGWSQFGDIYQEEYFMNILKDEVNIVKDLPHHLQSLNVEAIGSLITDADIMKEAKPIEFVKTVLPLLLRNGVVHFLGFGNRLGFDPLPFKLQRLRCKCNFHALKFVPKIQQVGSLLVRRIRKYDAAQSMLDKQLLGKFMPDIPSKGNDAAKGPSKFLALHLRFEMDMVAYSLCEFGGGENERKELQAYREIHFALLVERLKKTEPVSPAKLRKLGRCPLMPEEAALVLSGLGFKRGTYIYLAGSYIYGGKSRMQPFTGLYPNLVTKEDFLTPSELAPFRNYSSQLAALDFIACATADVFAMTDSGSQLSSLVSGYRIYYGDGRAPTLRPNKKRLAAILSENDTIGWNSFEERVRKMVEEGQRVRVRGVGRSIYRQPTCPECMCKSH
ncbi:hypothetical protein HHK36_001721 [Tetracentron sinense]|uniref:O-fucosyltransferase family protein n=1 Tax=Tetracentron sinense TaxID=13715 RepID=A0A835DRE1_TETSI|nr:hypothetical protein HHK36_001721 [Tetracentron sinense]